MNYNMLNELIITKFGSLENLARSNEWKLANLRKLMNGEREFKQWEIVKISTELELTNDQIREIFFPDWQPDPQEDEEEDDPDHVITTREIATKLDDLQDAFDTLRIVYAAKEDKDIYQDDIDNARTFMTETVNRMLNHLRGEVICAVLEEEKAAE